jgi:hypothetical protein
MKVGAALELEVPEVLEATITGPTSAQINPLHVDNPPVFTVRVRYAPMLAIDDITVFLIGKPGFVPPHITPQPGNPALGYVDFKTSSSSIAAHLGQILKVGYRVTRRGATTGSDELDLRVQAFAELSPNPLPFPTINGIASGGRLDLDTFSGNALAAVAKWPLSATGQRVWMTCSSSGVAPLKVLEGYAINPTEAANGLVNKVVLRSWLQALPDNSQITVTCKVTFDGSANEAQAVNFPQATYTILPSALIRDLTDFENNTFNGWLPNPAAVDPRDLIIREAEGNRYLANATYTNNSAGIVISKAFTNMRTDATYRFSMRVQTVERGPGFALPILSLNTNQGPVTTARTPATTWETFSGTMTPTSRTVEFQIKSHQASGIGNDYRMDDITIERL